MQLVELINSGEEGVFDLLYSRYRNWVVETAFRWTADPDASLDVLQETFLYLARKFPGFELRCQMKTFLYPVIKNLSLKMVAKNRRYEQSEAAMKVLESMPAESGPEPSSETLGRLLDSLSPPLREAVWLRYVDDLQMDEVAAALDIPVGTVKSRIHAALAILRNHPLARKYFE